MKIIKIEILTTGLGCSKCEVIMEKVNEVTKLFKNLEITELEVAKNPRKVVDNNIMSTPAIFLDDKLEFEGSVDVSELKKKILKAGGILNE